MRKLRIAFLGPTPPPVMGPSIATRIVLSRPPPDDLELIHVDTSDRRGLHTLGRLDLGNFRQAFRIYFHLLWVLLARRPRVVYIPISQTAIGYLRDSVLIVMAWLFRRRVILHLRGGNFDEFYAGAGRVLRGWVRWTLRRAHGIVVLGESLRRLFDRFVPAERIHVVPNGADFPEFDGLERAYADRERLRLLYLGNLLPAKGAADLVAALPAILGRHRGAEVVVAGADADPEYARRVRDAAERAGFGERVRFVGPVQRDAKVRLLRDADLFVYPSHFEGHPWVIVEALAAGLPVVSCDVGCVKECVLDGRNGRIVPVAEPATLAAVVNGLLDQPGELARMARESRAVYERGLTESHFRRRLFDVFRRVGRGDASYASRNVRAQASSVSSS